MRGEKFTQAWWTFTAKFILFRYFFFPLSPSLFFLFIFGLRFKPPFSFFTILFFVTFDYVTSSLQFDSLVHSRGTWPYCNYRYLLYRESSLILYHKIELFNIVSLFCQWLNQILSFFYDFKEILDDIYILFLFLSSSLTCSFHPIMRN